MKTSNTVWNKVSLLLIGIGLFWATGCDYMNFNVKSKEDYLVEYRQFIDEVSNKCGDTNYVSNRNYWENADQELYHYSHDLYIAFSGELNFREQLEIGKYPIMYYLCKYRGMVDRQVQMVYNKDTEILLRSLTEIMDSTAIIYDGFDKELRDMLLDFKSRNNN